MDLSKIIKEQRDLILKKYGFEINVEPAQLSDYKYTISTHNDGGFIADIYRDIKDELDSLLQLILYMESAPYLISYTEASAYDDCFQAVFKDWTHSNVVDYIRRKRNNSIKVDVEREIQDIGLQNITSLHCNNILGLEKSRTTLPELYAELKWLKTTAQAQNVNYESLIATESSQEKF